MTLVEVIHPMELAILQRNVLKEEDLHKDLVHLDLDHAAFVRLAINKNYNVYYAVN